MSNKGAVMAIKYYTTGITAQGYKSLLKRNLQGVEKIVAIKGAIDIQPFIDKIKSSYVEREYDLEYIFNPYSPDSYEAIINTTKGIAIVFEINEDAKPLKSIKIHKTFDLNQAINKDSLIKYKDYIRFLKKRRQECLSLTYFFLHNALLIHDEWEQIYIKNMNFEKINEIIRHLIEEIIGDNKNEEKNRGLVKERFLGATTQDGAKNYIDNLTRKICQRYFIKGRPGSGKSTILKAIAKAAVKRGFDIETYFCGFDSKSVDMVIIRGLNVAIFDATSPHEYSPTKEKDKLVDIYAEAIIPKTDEKFANAINEISMRYKSNITIATAHLAMLSKINEEIKRFFQFCLDKEGFDLILDEFVEVLKSR